MDLHFFKKKRSIYNLLSVAIVLAILERLCWPEQYWMSIFSALVGLIAVIAYQYKQINETDS